MCRLGNLGSFVIPNPRIQSSDKHQRFMQKRRDPVLVCRDPTYTMLDKRLTRIRQQPNRMQQVTDQHRLEHVKFKRTTCARYSNRGVIPHDLSADHSHCFTLRGIDLAGHNTRTRLAVERIYPGSFSGILISPSPQRGPLERYRTSFAIFIKLHARVLSAPEASTIAS
jgi:hypothetical protein